MTQNTWGKEEEGAVDLNLPQDASRRLWLTTACAVGGAIGLSTALPLINSFAPSAKARAAGAPVQADVGDLAPGQMRTVEWRGKPIWLVRRTEEQLKSIKVNNTLVADPESKRPGFTPHYAQNEYRSRKPELLVCVGICTHLGCSPTPNFQPGGGSGLPADWQGGFLCPCHGSTFDLAGRVFKNKPAPDNLEVPPYEYLNDSQIVIGIDEEHKA